MSDKIIVDDVRVVRTYQDDPAITRNEWLHVTRAKCYGEDGEYIEERTYSISDDIPLWKANMLAKNAMRVELGEPDRRKEIEARV